MPIVRPTLFIRLQYFANFFTYIRNFETAFMSFVLVFLFIKTKIDFLFAMQYMYIQLMIRKVKAVIDLTVSCNEDVAYNFYV